MQTRQRFLHGFAAVLMALSWRIGLAGTPPAIPAQAPAAQAAQKAEAVALPNREGSLKFAVLGDFGTGDKVQYETADQMAKVHERFPYELVITVGDNLYGSQRPQDFKLKFEDPYKALLDANTMTDASLTNTSYQTSGDVSAGYGNYVLTLQPKKGGAPVVLKGRFIDVAKKVGGKWVYVADLASNEPPPPAPPK